MKPKPDFTAEKEAEKKASYYQGYNDGLEDFKKSIPVWLKWTVRFMRVENGR